MPYLETPDDLANYLADKLGIYGGCDNDCTINNPCRCHWVSAMAERIKEAVRNEKILYPDDAEVKDTQR